MQSLAGEKCITQRCAHRALPSTHYAESGVSQPWRLLGVAAQITHSGRCPSERPGCRAVAQIGGYVRASTMDGSHTG
jgi:hypothetical protein